VVLKFLEAAVHSILFIRGIYPPELFSRVRMYDVPIRKSRSSLLNNYIRNVLGNIRGSLEKGVIERIAVQINNKNGDPIEKFVFELELVDCSPIEDDRVVLSLQSAFKSFFLKINLCETQLPPTPKDCTFVIVVYTSSTHLEEEKQGMWIEQENHQLRGEATIAALRSFECGVMKMQLFVETCEA